MTPAAAITATASARIVRFMTRAFPPRPLATRRRLLRGARRQAAERGRPALGSRLLGEPRPPLGLRRGQLDPRRRLAVGAGDPGARALPAARLAGARLGALVLRRL